MSEPVTVTRQDTFNTEPADDSSAQGSSIRHGNIELPIVTGHLDIHVNDLDAANDKQQLYSSLASSTRSSPIYATGGTSFREFRANVLKNARPSRAVALASRPSSLGGDTTSELDILSDVGLAGDSDTDAPLPSGLLLSVSARKKVPKGEPRIKIPSAKTDNVEPTIHEETTQEVLKLEIDNDIVSENREGEEEEDLNHRLLSRRPSVRSETILLDRSPKKAKNVSFNLVPYVSTVTPRKSKLTEEEEFIQEVTKKAAHLAAVGPVRANNSTNQGPSDISTSPIQEKPDSVNQLPEQTSPNSDTEDTQFNNSLDSSFYESDWQPRGSASPEKTPRRRSETFIKKDSSNTTDSVVAEGQGKPAKKHNSRDHPETLIPRTVGRVPNSDSGASLQNKRSPDSSSAQRERQADKQVISHTFETKIKPVFNARLDIGKRWSQGHTANEPGHGQQLNELYVKDKGGVTEGISASLPEIIEVGEDVKLAITCASQFDDADTGLTSDWNSDGASGVPKRRSHPKTDIPAQLSVESVAETERLSLQPASSSQETVNMASSDAYGYESETFEEILKDRNDLVKAEKTYQRRIRQLEDELKGMVNQCQMLSDENKELRRKLEEMKKPGGKDTLGGSVPNSDHVELAARVAKLETEKENMTKKSEELSGKLRDTEARHKQFDSVFVENTKLKTKNVELEKKAALLEKECQVLSNRIQDSDAETDSKIKSKDKHNHDLQQLVSDLRNENKSLKAKVNSKDNENATLAAALEAKRTEVGEMMKAMQNETTAEVELRVSHGRLEKAQEEVESVKKELEAMKQVLKMSEEGKSELQQTLNKKDNEAKRMRSEQDIKDKVVAELRQNLDRSKLEIRRLEDLQSANRDMEKESMYLKSRIASLKAEIESSLAENVRLKQDREEMIGEAQRLRVDASHTTEAVLESKKMFRKWENERDARNKVEVQLGKRDDDVHLMETRLKEAANQMNTLHAKIKALESERAQLANTSVQELNTNNKILTTENKKLRQMLVERNIELTHKNTEQNVFDSRIKVLERKQKDADVRVKQLSGWVVNAEVTRFPSNDHTSGKIQQPHQNHHQLQQKRQSAPEQVTVSKSVPSEKATLPPRPHNNDQTRHSTSHEPRQVSRHFSDKSILGVTEPKVAFVSPRARPKPPRRTAHSTLTPPPEWEEPRKRTENRETGANHTPLSLPLILDTAPVTPPDSHGGYFMLYKEKVKRMQQRRF